MSVMNEETTATREKLLDDFNKVVADTEDLLKTAVTAGGEKANAWRANLEQKLQLTKQRLQEIERSAADSTTAAMKATDTYVHENPWQAVAIAAGVGALIGILVSRR